MLSPKYLLLLSLFSALPVATTVSAETLPPKTQISPNEDPIKILPESGIPQTWLQGVPVERWEKDKVYIFEFWATWCGPCLAAIPHMNAIHKKITQENLPVQLVGVNIHDRLNPDQLKDFLAKRSTPPAYTIAVDTDKRTDKNWLKPLKLIGIPFAIAVKNGDIIWRGHPVRLSSELVHGMTHPDFSKFRKTQNDIRQNTENAKKRVNEIAALFAAGEDEKAEFALNALLEDPNTPDSQKISALDLPCYRALKTENFRKMNAALRRLAETFPQNFRTQIQVVNFISATDDIPVEERDLALALECLNRADALSKDIPDQRSFVQSRLGDIYSARGDAENARHAYVLAWELSSEYAGLKKLREKLEKIPESAELLTLFDDLASGAPKAPDTESGNKSEVSANTKPEFVRECSESPEAESLLKLLRSLDWIRGQCPETLPKNGVLFVDIWTAPQPGPHNPFLSRKPAAWLDEKLHNVPEAETLVIALESNPGRAEKTLTFPRYQTPHPVAVAAERNSDEKILKHFKITELPASAAFRDGKLIWSGSAQEMPEWLINEAVLPEYDHAAAEIRRAEEQKVFSQTAKALSVARNLANHQKFDEARTKIEELRDILALHPVLDMMASEILIIEPLSRKNFKEVGRICEELLKKYPTKNFIAEHQMKILNETPELRAATRPVLILACKNVIAGGTPYKSAYLSNISALYEEDGDFRNAIYAAFAARDASAKYRKSIRK